MTARFRIQRLLFRALIFDLDGTLVDSAEGISKCLSELSFRRGSGPVGVDQVRSLISKGVDELVSKTINSSTSIGLEADIVEFRKIYGDRRTERCELFSGVKEGLAKLGKYKIPMGICTNKPQILAERVLQDTDLISYFPCIVGSDSTKRAKPDALHPATVARGLQVDIKDCILVGDSEIDAKAASNAGIPFVLMRYGYASEANLLSDVAFEHFESFVAEIAPTH